MNDVKQVIVVRKDLNMRKGKLGAQIGHAAMMFLVDNNESDRADELVVKLTADEVQWFVSGSIKKIVLAVDSQEELEQLIFQAEMSDVDVYPVIDKGLTEFHGIETLTCAAFGPCQSDAVDKITGHLKPL